MKRRGDADGLVRALSYEDPVTDRSGRFVDLGRPVREAAVEALIELDARVMHDGLVRGLDDPEERVREAAKRGIESARAIFEGLIRALGDPEESVRILAVRGLREHGEPGIASPLIIAAATWSSDEYMNARQEAVDALVSLKEPDVARRMAAAMLTREPDLDDEDVAVLRRVIEATHEGAAASTIHDLVMDLRHQAAAPRARTLLVGLAPGSVEPLIEALGNRDAQKDAALALGSIHDGRAVRSLCSLLETAQDASTRKAAAWALGELRDPRAAEALLGAASDPEYEVRAEANASFDRLGNAAIALVRGSRGSAARENGTRPPHDLATRSGDTERSWSQRAHEPEGP